MNTDTIPDQPERHIQHKTREELLDLLNAYQQAIDVNIISSITDTEGIITHVNTKFCEVSKYSREELIGQNHRIINSGFHSKEFFKRMWQTLKKGEVWRDEIRNRAKDGSYYWVDTVILPVLSKDKNIVQYLSLRQLITERKKADADRAEYIEKLQQMLHMTSHRVRSPLATCLGLMNLIEDDKLMNKEEFDVVLRHLKSSATELDTFTRELTVFMAEIEKKYNHPAADPGI